MPVVWGKTVMDVRICDKCDLFSCRLTRSVTHIGNGFRVVNYLIVIECDGDSVAVEAVGSAVVTNAKVSPIDIGIAETSVESLPDEVRQDYKNAISRIVAKLAEVECPCECKYSAEQLVFELNQLKPC